MTKLVLEKTENFVRLERRLSPEKTQELKDFVKTEYRDLDHFIKTIQSLSPHLHVSHIPEKQIITLPFLVDKLMVIYNEGPPFKIGYLKVKP